MIKRRISVQECQMLVIYIKAVLPDIRIAPALECPHDFLTGKTYYCVTHFSSSPRWMSFVTGTEYPTYEKRRFINMDYDELINYLQKKANETICI